MTATKKIKVCFPFIGDFVGGSHLSALGLIRNLDTTRIEPTIVLHETDGPLARLLRDEGVSFERAPVPNRIELSPKVGAATIGRFLRTIPRLAGFIRRRGFDIVHTNDGRMHVTWGVAARLANTQVLWHHRGDPTSLGLRWVAPFVASHVASVSKFSSPPRGLISAASKASVVESPFDLAAASGIDRLACRETLAQEIECPPETRILGYVGFLMDRKRPLLFVEAIAALNKMNPGFPVAGVLLGEAMDRLDDAARARAAELGIADKIHLLGFRYPGLPWIAALDVLLVTAVDEPLGRTLVEAMLVGTPVIATSSGGNVEVIEQGRTGLLVPPEDAAAFARSAIELLTQPAYRDKITSSAADSVTVRFSIDRHVRSITAIYERLVARR